MKQHMRVAVYMRIAHKERAWIYCRVAAPDAFALRAQQEALEAYAEKEMYEVVGATSEQENGLSLIRDGIAEISRAAEQRKMDVLLIANTSRLGRDALEVKKYIHWLECRGVRVACMNGSM